MDALNNNVNTSQIQALKQRLLEPANIILSYANILRQNETYQSLIEFEEELGKILASSDQLLNEIEKATTNVQLNENEIQEYQKKTRHDLRNVINIILGYSEMILEDLESDHANFDDISNLLEETKKFNQNLEQLVQLNLIQKNQSEISAEDEVLKKLISMIKPLDSSKENNRLIGNILIVDDNVSNCEMIERQLKKEGHKTKICFDGEQALTELKRNEFDTILLDVLMPKKNGYEVLMEMKKNLKLKDIPVIMVSGFKEEDTIVRCIEAGVDEYLTKPINSTLLKAKINSSLERKKYRDKQKHDIKVASEVQQSLIPREAHFPAGFFASNTAAKGVSGDFFDFVDIDSERYSFVLADVSGKGMHAGILMAKTSALFRRLSKSQKNLKDLVTVINNELCETASRGMFVTAVFGMFYKKENRIEFINTGHEPVLIATGPDSFIDIESKAPPIGMFDINQNQLKIENFKPTTSKSYFFVFTDGVTEGRDKNNKEIEREGVKKIITKNFSTSSQKIIKLINKEILFENATLHDDVTIVGIELKAG